MQNKANLFTFCSMGWMKSPFCVIRKKIFYINICLHYGDLSKYFQMWSFQTMPNLLKVQSIYGFVAFTLSKALIYWIYLFVKIKIFKLKTSIPKTIDIIIIDLVTYFQTKSKCSDTFVSHQTMRHFSMAKGLTYRRNLYKDTPKSDKRISKQ